MAINYLGRLATSRDALQTKMNLICGIAGTPTVPVRKIRHIEDVLSLLATFPDCAGYAANRRGEPLFDLETEAGVQDLVYLILRPSIPDLVPEQPVAGPTRQHVIEDFRSQLLRLVIEAKLVRDKRHGRTLKTELHTDIGEYKNDPLCDDLIFFIRDPNMHIESPSGLMKGIQGVHTHEQRSLRVHCLVQR